MQRISIIIISIATMAILGCGNKKPTTSTLTGKLDSISTGALVALVTKPDLSGTDFKDTIKLDADGSFTYTLENDIFRYVTIAQLPSKGKKLYEENKGNKQLVMMPGECVNITGTLSNAKISGGPFYKDKERADALLNPHLRDFEKFSKMALDFIKDNPDSDYSYYLATNLKEPLKSEALQVLTDKVKNGPVKAFDDGLTALFKANEERKKAIEEARKALESSEHAPDFTLNDINGNPLTLSSLRGKYVVMDFWGSWCGWCIKGFPSMKEAYAKHKGKIEFLGIACGDNLESWKEAVEKHQIPWLNVINEGDIDVSDLYAITGYPTKVVLNKEGKIIKTFIGEVEEFYTYLDKLP